MFARDTGKEPIYPACVCFFAGFGKCQIICHGCHEAHRRERIPSWGWCAYADGTSEMRTLLYIFAICSAALFLFVTVNRLERNRPLALLLMILILGVTAAAVLKQLMPWR
jgi:hypothetical protein